MAKKVDAKRVNLDIKPYGVAQFGEEELSLSHGFSTLPSGNMSNGFGDPNMARENRKSLLSFFDLSPQAIVTISPKHGDKIRLVGSESVGERVECDSLITARHGVGLALLPADCYPVIITGSNDRKYSLLSLVHSGLKGTRLGIVAKTIQRMKEIGVTTTSMRIAIGPGIGPCCYNGTDLVSEIVTQIIEQGILERNIVVADCCTCCSKDSRGDYLFFSHSRAVRAEKEEEGRFMVFVASL